jgi:hypothetical protein
MQGYKYSHYFSLLTLKLGITFLQKYFKLIQNYQQTSDKNIFMSTQQFHLKWKMMKN